MMFLEMLRKQGLIKTVDALATYRDRL